MKKATSIVLLFTLLTVYVGANIVNANSYCEECCVSAGAHCCTTAGSAVKTWQHTVYISGQPYTCCEWTMRRYLSFTCVYCYNHWDEMPLIDHAYMHDTSYACTQFSYIVACGAEFHPNH